MPAACTLAVAVFVIDPTTHTTLLLEPGTQITAPAIAEQITHPGAWTPEPRRQSGRTKAETQ
ncbi:hypothetical protein ACFVGN_00990 [Streptomyces sp. NPDC057757]|uniref:hypothetical protein n=1 Tax=Streptomyces sp. NPDC057757 TaxID=3346241 RepID=UPI0036C9BF7D